MCMFYRSGVFTLTSCNFYTQHLILKLKMAIFVTIPTGQWSTLVVKLEVPGIGPGHICKKLYILILIRENRQLVTNEPVEFAK